MAAIQGNPRVFVQEGAPVATDYPNDPPSRPPNGDVWVKPSTPTFSIFINNVWKTVTIS